jgi:hypothetical protein
MPEKTTKNQFPSAGRGEVCRVTIPAGYGAVERPRLVGEGPTVARGMRSAAARRWRLKRRRDGAGDGLWQWNLKGRRMVERGRGQARASRGR